MATFKYNKESDSRESIVARVVALYNKSDRTDQEDRNLSKLQKRVRQLDKVPNSDAIGYYRQLDDYCLSQA